MKSCFQLTILSLILIPFIVAEYTDDSSETPPLAGGYTSDFFENAGNVGVIAAAGNISPSGNTNNIAVPTTTEPSLSEVAVERAVSWLRTQRSQDWGWYNDTPNVLLALQLAAYTELNQIPETTFETQLSTKQMEIEILIMLWRHHEYPISPGRLARYALALNSLCHDPRQFHGHDLIGLLLHHESQKDADFALSALSACSASAHVRKRQIRRLLDIANAVNDHNVDTVAIVILALKCIVQDHRHRNLQHFVRRPGLGLARQQLPDGGFGNLRATALAIQALQNEEFTINHHWNQTAAIGWLLSHQTEQGNFGDITATTDAILALSWRGLSAVRSLECGHVEDPTLENHVEIDDSHFKAHLPNPMNDTEARNVTLTYTLWVGTNVTENYTLAVTVPRNVTFYNVMQIAGEMDNHFTFAASEWPNGHYVHTLAGFKEEPMGYHYWLLYRLPTLPDPSNPPANQLVAPGGVDDLLVDDGEHYLFWYKKL